MTSPMRVAEHYTHGSLLGAIANGLEKLGKFPDTVTVEDLGPVDEFHIGGRVATESFLDQLDLQAEDHVLDVGCGLGGASRFVAQRYGCRVTGIDLTQEYIETGRVLCSWVELSDRVTLDQGNATGTLYPAGSFDKAYMLHVGMNIADKHVLVAELQRVLRPGGTLGVYDVMRVGDGDLTYPVPWATTADGSSVATPDEYRAALEAAGFEVTAARDRGDFALEFFRRLQGNATAAGGPPPLGVHLLMGESAPVKVRNLVESISQGCAAPVEMIATRVA
jgi:SAM-dependent methyltransferase